MDEIQKDALQFAEHSMAWAAACLEEHGEIVPMIVLLVMLHPETKQPLDEPGHLPCVFLGSDDPEENKRRMDQWSEGMRNAAAEFHAIGYALMTEAWVMAYDGDGPPPTNLAERDDKSEALVVSVKHRALGDAKTFIGLIARDHANAPKISDFVETPSSGGPDHERFLDILPPLN